MAKRDVTIRITGKDEASGALKKVGTSVGKLSGGLNVLKVAAAGAFAFLAAGKLARMASATVAAFGIQEKSEIRLAQALRNRGLAVKENLDLLKQEAAALQELTVVGDEVTIQIQAQAIAMGLAADKTTDLVLASANLAAATGKDLNSAAQQIIKTLGGYGGELGEILPQLKELTAEQLKQGEVIGLINELFADQAKAYAETTEGGIIQMTNALGDLREHIGSKLAPTTKAWTEQIKDSTPEIAEWVDTLLRGVGAVASLGKQFKETKIGGFLDRTGQAGVDALAGLATGLFDTGTSDAENVRLINERRRGFKLKQEAAGLAAVTQRVQVAENREMAGLLAARNARLGLAGGTGVSVDPTLGAFRPRSDALAGNLLFGPGGNASIAAASGGGGGGPLLGGFEAFIRSGLQAGLEGRLASLQDADSGRSVRGGGVRALQSRFLSRDPANDPIATRLDKQLKLAEKQTQTIQDIKTELARLEGSIIMVQEGQI